MRVRIFVLALGIAAAAATPVAAAGRATPPDEAAGYWTAERVQGAQARDVVLDIARGPAYPNAKPDNAGKPDKSPDGGTDPVSTTVTGAPWPDTDGDPIDDLVGKVLFTLGTNNYVCSASTIAPTGVSVEWVVMTAGHCAWDDDLKMAKNWVFVPDYEIVRTFGCGTPVGDLGTSAGSCYAAESLHPHANWMATPGDDYRNDVAFARMANPRPPLGDLGPGATLPVLRTTTPTTQTTAIGSEVTALGYPAAKKYSGSDLIYCLGVPLAGPSPYVDNPALACDMTGGSSGGPWYSDTNGDGVLEATSLNSFGLRGYNGFMFGPLFDGGAEEALAAASSS
jgi:hypothetical protein